MSELPADLTMREQLLKRLGDMAEPSVLIVGGGINGIGLYRELVLQGVDVVLVEKADFCSGASAALSRMIHGGLRYLEYGEFRLVREALRERNRLLANAPHFVRPLPTVVPIFHYFSGVFGALKRFLRLSDQPARRGALTVKLGLLLYGLFTRASRAMPGHRFLGKRRAFAQWPDFHPEVKCCAVYHDASISHPERLGIELINDTAALGERGLALNYMRVDGSDGDAVQIVDQLSGERYSLRPQLVVNATGAWLDFTNGFLSSAADNRKTEMIGGSKGSHLVIRNAALSRAVGDHMVYFENNDGRVCIMFRYFGNVLVGTTDLQTDDPDANRCEDFERDYILQSLSFVFPDLEVGADDIVFAFSGVRPLPHSDGTAMGEVSRDHHIETILAGHGSRFPVLCLIGGKWTTFRAFAEQAADKVLVMLGRPRLAGSADLAIGGGRSFPVGAEALARYIAGLVRSSGLAPGRIEDLVARYGTGAEAVLAFIGAGEDRPLNHHDGYSAREIIRIIRDEHVTTVADILLRRTSIAMSSGLNLPLIDEVLSLLAAERHWDEAKTTEARAEFLHQLAYFNGLDFTPSAGN